MWKRIAAATVAVLAASAGVMAVAMPSSPSLVQTCEASQRAAMTAAMHNAPEPAAPPECQRMTDAQWSKVNKDLDGLHNQLVAVKLEASTPTATAAPDQWIADQYTNAAKPDQWITDQYANTAH